MKSQNNREVSNGRLVLVKQLSDSESNRQSQENSKSIVTCSCICLMAAIWTLDIKCTEECGERKITM